MTDYPSFQGDMNDLTRNCRGYVDSVAGVTNFPSFITGSAPFVTLYTSNGTLIQIVSGDGGIAIRNYIWASWTVWKRVDNFGCNTLAELKAALANV